MAEPFPDLVQSAVPDRPWRRSTGRRGNHGATRQQAAITGRWLRSEGMRALYASPIRRAHEPTGCIASITGLTIQPDARLRERLNWDGDQPFDAFLTLWSATAPRPRARGRRVSTASGRAVAGFPRRPAGPGRTWGPGRSGVRPSPGCLRSGRRGNARTARPSIRRAITAPGMPQNAQVRSSIYYSSGSAVRFAQACSLAIAAASKIGRLTDVFLCNLQKYL